METWTVDHSDTYAADDPGADVKILNNSIERKASTGGVQVSVYNPITNLAPVRFVVAGDNSKTAFVVTPGRTGTVGGEKGLDWPADNIVGKVYSAAGPENVDVTVSVRRGQ